MSASPFDKIFTSFNFIKGVTATSGTTGKGPLVTFLPERMSMFEGKRVSASYLGTKNKIIELGIKYYLLIKPPFSINNSILENRSPFAVIADPDNFTASAEIASRLRIEAIHTTPTILYFFTPYLKKKYDLKKIKFIQFGGELCSNEKLMLFKRTFPNSYITNRYVASEGPVITWQCEYLAQKNLQLQHLLPGTIAECLDTLTGEEVARGDVGELVYTILYPDVFVPIRYRTGDYVIFKEEKCKCKKPYPIFEALGKIGYDSIAIQGTKLLISDILDAIKKTKGLVNDFKAHVHERIRGGRIYYIVEVQLIPKDKKNLKNLLFKEKIRDKMEKNLYISSSLTYKDLVDKDVFLPLKVEFMEKLPHEPKRRYFTAHY